MEIRWIDTSRSFLLWTIAISGLILNLESVQPSLQPTQLNVSGKCWANFGSMVNQALKITNNWVNSVVHSIKTDKTVLKQRWETNLQRNQTPSTWELCCEGSMRWSEWSTLSKRHMRVNVQFLAPRTFRQCFRIEFSLWYYVLLQCDCNYWKRKLNSVFPTTNRLNSWYLQRIRILRICSLTLSMIIPKYYNLPFLSESF